ncbi:MAG: TatD family hydrolase [Pseudomonadota bacterium]|nr:TatD family hydrolase [Pseudomonadota bacterium]
MLIDTHCHLDDPDLSGDLDGVVARALAAGVGRMVTISTHMSTLPAVRAVAERFPNVWFSVGVHPHHAADDGEMPTVDQLVAVARHPKAAGIGECGLDYFYEHSPRDQQQEGFRRHIRAALQTGLPLIVHTRDAEEDTMRILREEADGKGLRGVLHCFTSSRWLAEQAVGFGFYISLSGILTFKKSADLRETAKHVPLERLLVETDAPWLAPEPHRGKNNEPAFVVHTAAVLAGLKGIPVEELARKTTENALRLFDRMSAPASSLT